MGDKTSASIRERVQSGLYNILVNPESPDIFEAISYDETTHCASGKTFQDCHAAQSLLSKLGLSGKVAEATDHIPDHELIYLRTHSHLPLGCVSCKVMCEISEVVVRGSSEFHAQLRAVKPEIFERTRSPILNKIMRDALASLQEKGDQVLDHEVDDNTMDDGEIFDTID